jgi:hypothetical protein
MKHSLKRLLWALTLLPLLAGCVGAGDVELLSVKDVTYKDYSNNQLQLDVEAVIRNDCPQPVKLLDGSLTLWHDGSQLGSVRQREAVKLKARTEATYTLPLTVSIERQGGSLNALFRLLMNGQADMRLKGSLKAKTFLLSKTFEIDKQLR